ncbi:hypothetical protein BV25DRAFT_649165 [Artomyces pyxidatus]|uniref:Uncharacterized protein n=1 Tax=Artomyces pyxidatus TaxID=48021 RepID=A0ACB8SDK5_9AGAM|nr:hypothetical protein BV25DRAFT_649165 [Artomyces pyxidatus]
MRIQPYPTTQNVAARQSDRKRPLMSAVVCVHVCSPLLFLVLSFTAHHVRVASCCVPSHKIQHHLPSLRDAGGLVQFRATYASPSHTLQYHRHIHVYCVRSFHRQLDNPAELPDDSRPRRSEAERPHEVRPDDLCGKSALRHRQKGPREKTHSFPACGIRARLSTARDSESHPSACPHQSRLVRPGT